MPRALDDDKRQAILADIRTGNISRNAIARKHGVANSTVSKLAQDTGVVDAFDRTKTENATRAKRFDAKLARAQLIEDLYADAQRFRARVWDPYTQVITSNTGPELITTLQPPLRDQQAGITAMAVAIDKALALERVDSDEGAAAGKTMINDLFGAMNSAYHQIVTEDAIAESTAAPAVAEPEAAAAP